MNLILKDKISRKLEVHVDALIVRDFENSYINQSELAKDNI